MFEREDGGAAAWGSGPTVVLDADEWAWPGRPETPPPPEPDVVVARLVEVVDALLAQDVTSLSPVVARERARTLLAQHSRLGLVVGRAVLDVQARELHVAERSRS